MESPFATVIGPGFVDILADSGEDSVHVPFRVVGPSDAVSIEVFRPEGGEVACSYPAKELLEVLEHAMVYVSQVMPE